MVMMTAKVNKKKIFLILAAFVALIVLICVLSGKDGNSGNALENPQNQPVSMETNDGRVKFLSDLGWQVTTSPVETQQVRIPTEVTEVFERYNTLQLSQGYDLNPLAGKTVMRYVYQVENYPNATDPVYATLLVYDNQVVGADITDTSAGGVVQGLQMPG